MPTNVKIISRTGKTVLVDWHDGVASHRAYLPAALVTTDAAGNSVADQPERGIPYGAPWAEWVKVTLTPAAIEAALHQYGIWTVGDLLRHHTQALAALQSLIARDLRELIRAAQDHQRQQS